MLKYGREVTLSGARKYRMTVTLVEYDTDAVYDPNADTPYPEADLTGRRFSEQMSASGTNQEIRARLAGLIPAFRIQIAAANAALAVIGKIGGIVDSYLMAHPGLE